MTKQIRIENADTSTWPVRVTVQHKTFDAEGNATGWADADKVQLDHPTKMHETYITSGRRLVIEELAADPAPAP
jgi:hypothetical protein